MSADVRERLRRHCQEVDAHQTPVTVGEAIARARTELGGDEREPSVEPTPTGLATTVDVAHTGPRPLAILGAVAVVLLLVAGLVGLVRETDDSDQTQAIDTETSVSTPTPAAPSGELRFGGWTWTRTHSELRPMSTAGMVSVTDGGPGLVAVGWEDPSAGSSGEWDAAVWTSEDGSDWERVPHDEEASGGPGAGHMTDVVDGGPGLVAVGHDGGIGTAWTSVDGREWSRVELDGAPDGPQHPTAVAVGGPGLVAVGSGRATAPPAGPSAAAVWTSEDGVGWTRVPHDEALFGGPDDQVAMSSVVAGGPGLVAVGSVWRTGSAGTNDDGSAAVWTSVDGRSWMRVPHDEGTLGGAGQQVMTSVTVGRPGFVAVGYELTENDLDAVVWTSVDGWRWSRVSDDGPVFAGESVQRINSVIQAGPVLVAVGQAASVTAGVWMSGDGEEWCRVPDPAGLFAGWGMTAVTTDGTDLVAVNEQTAVWTATADAPDADPCRSAPPPAPLSCGPFLAKSPSFVEGDPPSEWFDLPAGEFIMIDVGLWDLGTHEEDPPESAERVFVEFDDGRVTPTTPDLPDGVHRRPYRLGVFERGDATRWRAVHAPDPDNGTPDSIRARFQLQGCGEGAS